MKLADIAPDRASLLELEARFWSKVNVRDEDECWPWIGGTGGSGPSWKRGTPIRYGRFGVGANRVLSAHRVACILTYGDMPDGLFGCHHCDFPLCCNPAHLFAGTARDNAEDRDRKGRYVLGKRYAGEQHCCAILTEADVLEIRRVYAGVRSGYRSIGEQYGVSAEQIGAILRGETWKHL